MHKNPAMQSLNLKAISETVGAKLLSLSGQNTGNLLFTSAMFSQVEGAEVLNAQLPPTEWSNQYSHVCIPAANWIYPPWDFGWLADSLEKSRLPVCCIGLGAQMGKEDIPKLTKGTRRFLDVLSEQSESIGVRGENTAEILSEMGIYNFEVLGCPSLFHSFDIPSVTLPDTQEAPVIGMAFTRFGLRPGREDTYQQELAQAAIKHANSIYFQSEIEEILFLANELDISQDLASFYSGSVESVRAALLKKGKVFNNVEDWVRDLARCSFYISSRIHGCVSAILAGTPAILLTHDHRTRELADSMHLPNLPIAEFKPGHLSDYEWILEKTKPLLDAPAKWSVNKKKLIAFYSLCNVPMRSTLSDE